MKKTDLQSRREFFKEAARKALPVLGAIALAGSPLVVNADKCKSCKMCMKIGCPAIAMKDGKAKIDATLCVGCGVCSQMCKFGAL